MLLLLFPKDTNFIRIKPLNSWFDRFLRYIQSMVITERVVQQRLINLLELLNLVSKKIIYNWISCCKKVITPKLRYFQYELCLLYLYLRWTQFGRRSG